VHGTNTIISCTRYVQVVEVLRVEMGLCFTAAIGNTFLAYYA